MPLIVTDGDVLAQIDTTDGDAQGVDAALRALGAKVPPETIAGWEPWFAAYQQWSKDTRAALSGGFIGGAWFGVPELGNQALAKGQELGQWIAIVNNAAAGRAGPAVAGEVSPLDVAAQNATLPPLPGLDTDTKLLVGLGLAFLLIWTVKR